MWGRRLIIRRIIKSVERVLGMDWLLVWARSRNREEKIVKIVGKFMGREAAWECLSGFICSRQRLRDCVRSKFPPLCRLTIARLYFLKLCWQLVSDYSARLRSKHDMDLGASRKLSQQSCSSVLCEQLRLHFIGFECVSKNYCVVSSRFQDLLDGWLQVSGSNLSIKLKSI